MSSRDLALTDGEFADLRGLLLDAAGLVFDATRRESLACSLAARLRATGAPDVGAYLALVRAPGSAERQRLLDEVTIQETCFFRFPPQMRALRQHVLPELLRAAEASGRRLRVWSAGCSTGEEPYTIAMLLADLLPASAGWDVEVIATDLSEQALEAARAATYGRRSVQLATPEQRARFFTTTPEGSYVVRPEIRSRVRFRRHNLVRDALPADGLDLVLCRNVTIYFDRPTTRALMGRVHASLRDGGFLLLGHSETLWQVNEDFRLVPLGSGDDTTFVYRRADAPQHATPVPAAPVPDVPLPRPARSGRTRPAPVPASGPGRAGRGVVRSDLVTDVRTALAQGRYDEAARLARRAAVGEPLRADVHYLLGLALVDLGREAEALPALRRAVYLDPDAGLAHFLLAGALHRSGDPVAAAREYRAAARTLGRRPGDGDAPELGGRSPRELAALCAELAVRLGEPAPGAAGTVTTREDSR